MKYLNYTIKLNSPIIFSVRGGDLNSVDSFKYIPGSAIKGVLASQFIKQNKLERKAHENEEFYNIFLEDAIFTNAYIKKNGIKYFPTPLSLFIDKSDGKDIYNMLEIEETKLDKGKKYKSPGSFFTIQNNHISVTKVKTIRNFHHSREDNRIRGHSVEGKIFYYEAIARHQEFEGKIIGSNELLIKLKKLIDKNNNIRLGRSKTAQYGSAIIAASDISDFLMLKDIPSEFNLTFTSPTIIYNEYGVSTVSVDNFKKYLENFGITVDIKKSYIKAKHVSNYVSVKHCKDPEEWAYAEGSSFRIAVDDISKAIQVFQELYVKGVGRKTKDGFGRFKIDQIKGSIFSLTKVQNTLSPTNNNLDWNNIPKHIKQLSNEIIEKTIINEINKLILYDYNEFKEYMRKGEVITKSLAGRIELILLKSEGVEDFISKIEQFREQATSQLENCKNKRTTLLKIINSKYPVDKIIIPNDLKEIAEKISFKMDSFKYYKKYWQLFVILVRKNRREK